MPSESYQVLNMLPEYKTSVTKVDNADKMSGKAIFTDDIQMDGVLTAVSVRSTIARGRIHKISVPILPEGYYFISAKDVVKENICNIIFDDWPTFADKEVHYLGETIGLVVGEDKETCLDLANQIGVFYEEETPIYEMTNSFIHKEFTKGDPKLFKGAKKVFKESFTTGYQEQAYLETQGMLVYFDKDVITVKASMQCPFYIHKAIMRVTGYPEDKVRVIQPAVGGAFGGKEHYPSLMGGQLATALLKIKKPIKMIFDRV